MSFDKQQFADLIRRVLHEHDLYSDTAVNLLLGTAAQESAFGTYLRQLDGGPALGVFQMEPATFDWLHGKYSILIRSVRNRQFTELEWNLKLAILLARLRYRADPHPLPDADDVSGLAAYWKRVYNTVQGSGTIGEFEANYRKYILQ